MLKTQPDPNAEPPTRKPGSQPAGGMGGDQRRFAMSQTQQPTDDNPDTALEDEWVVWDLTNDNQRTADDRGGAENMVETLEELADDGETVETETFPPGEGVPQVSAEDYLSGDYKNAESDDDTEPAKTEVVTEETNTSIEQPTTDAPANVGGVVDQFGIDNDPLSVLPGWMTTEVSYSDKGDSSTTVNKRGCQVIAEYLGLEPEITPLKRANETGFEFATYECEITKPDGRTFTGTGTARATPADQGEDAGWKLDMMAETRAYKRAVKSATGGGLEAFVKEQASE